MDLSRFSSARFVFPHVACGLVISASLTGCITQGGTGKDRDRDRDHAVSGGRSGLGVLTWQSGGSNVSASSAGRETVIVAGAVGTVVAVMAAPVLVADAVGMLEGRSSSSKGTDGDPPDAAMVEKFKTVPAAERESLGHYNDDIPTVSQARRVPNSDVDWRGLSVSPIYVFDSGLDLHEHTGWGGVVDYSVIMRERSRNWYSKFGTDFVFFQTDANTTHGGIDYSEEIQAYRMHVNLGMGVRYYDFDFSVWIGAGMGATHTRGTEYNADGSHTSVDAVAQAGARLAYQPTDWCSIFAGYRAMWSVPFQVIDDRDDARYKFPSLSVQSVEVGVTFLF